MPSSSEQLFELDGRKLTYDRYRYELAIRNQHTLEQVNTLAMDEGRSVVSVAADFTQQEYGGLLRGVIPQLLDKYGNINATAALSYYEQARRAWYDKKAYNSAGRDANRTRSQRYAAAVTQGGIRKASITAAEYKAVYADTYDLVGKTDAIVNYAMKVRATSGHMPSVAAMENALTREVAAYHRDTVLFNAGLDKSVSKVQRVAQAKACEFCRMMALGSTNGTVRLSDYAAKFHSHCHCTIQALFEGDKPIRPDYYDQFEAEYLKAKHETNGTNAGFKQTLENWRANNRSKPSLAPTFETISKTEYPRLAERINFQRVQGFTSDTYDKAVSVAVREYTSGSGEYQNINGLLRDAAGYAKYLTADEALNTKANIENLTRIIDDAPRLDKPLITSRGIEPGRIADTIGSLKPGATIQDLGFTSTSVTKEVAAGFAKGDGVVLEIQNPAGTKGLMTLGFRTEWNAEDLSSMAARGIATEYEWLLQRGTTLEVIEPLDPVTRVIKVKVK